MYLLDSFPLSGPQEVRTLLMVCLGGGTLRDIGKGGAVDCWTGVPGPQGIVSPPPPPPPPPKKKNSGTQYASFIFISSNLRACTSCPGADCSPLIGQTKERKGSNWLVS